VAIGVIGIDVVVVVLPVLGADVIRRVDVDAINLARVTEPQRLERVVVLALDYYVMRLVTAPLDRTEPLQARIDRIAELSDDYEV